MKKILLALVGSFLLSGTLLAQCDLFSLFPFVFGVTKSEVLKQLPLIKGPFKVKTADASQTYINSGKSKACNFVDKPKYLKGVAVNRSQVEYSYETHSCLTGTYNIVDLYFADDKLYKMVLKAFFKPENAQKCIDNYNQIIDSLGTVFPFTDKYESKKPDTKERNGEGRLFYMSSEEDRNKDYEVMKKIKGNWTEVSYSFSDSKEYTLEIKYISLDGVKLDFQGY